MAFGSKANAGSAPPEQPPAGPDLIHIPAFLGPLEARAAMANLLAELDLRPDALTIAGQAVSTKRLHDFRADPGKSYHYSGGLHGDLPWTPTLLSLREAIQDRLALSFNSCLCNFYADGAVGMGWHADKEMELGSEPNVASLSLGATRLFRFRRRAPWREAKGYEKWEFHLAAGDLLLMRGSTQLYFEHELAKQAKVVDPRLNLTFRQVLGSRPAAFDALDR
jgi:alkylated DNA repair dioxygenase AlkB